MRAAPVLLGALLAAAGHAHAQAPYPNRPIRVLIPYAPGGSSDAVGRIVTQRLGDVLGQSFVIDNRPGAAGMIGRDLAAKAAPDGYTLIVSDAVHTINVHVLRKLPYDPVKDFTFITLIGLAPMVLAVHPSGPATLKDLVAAAKAQPGRINYGNGGTGSITHLTGELFKVSAQVDLAAIPYKSIGLAVNDLLGGQIPVAFPSLPGSVNHARAGRLRVLAVSSEKRTPSLPEAPTFAEGGVPGVIVSNWFGLMGPARLPQAIVERLRNEVAAIAKQPEVRERFAALSLDISANTPAEFKAMAEAEIARWGRVVKQAGIKPE